jgi:SAM-dependent methyltransferase
MNEASKTRKLWGPEEARVLKGDGIDIGCGPDPISESVQRFDLEHGDANEIGKYVHREFDFVFSAHCLEHMRDPQSALLGWWELVRPGGHLIVLVPDEDLYEQGYWPSLFNADHKSTFTIAKQNSWSPRSLNVSELVNRLPGAEVVSIKLQDKGYDRRRLQFAAYPRPMAKTLARGLGLLIKLGGRIGLGTAAESIARLLRVPTDQTQNGAVAQIQALVRKKVGPMSGAVVDAVSTLEAR